MEYKNIFHVGDSAVRYVLSNQSKNPLLVFGINPSTADDKKPDRTIKKVMGFANRNGFDGFIMLNLYPQRTPNTNELHAELDEKLMQENLKQIELALKDIPNPTILAAWGNPIRQRKYLKECVKQIHYLTKGKNVKWQQIGKLTVQGNPRHPLYARYTDGLCEFEVEQYVEKLK